MHKYIISICQPNMPTRKINVIAKHVVDAILICKNIYPESTRVMARAA